MIPLWTRWHPADIARYFRNQSEPDNDETHLRAENARLIQENAALEHELQTAHETLRSISQWAHSATQRH